MKRIVRVLVASRGEIAARIIRACKALGIESVLAVSGLETNLAFHRRVVDHADFRNATINTRWLEDVVLGSARRAA